MKTVIAIYKDGKLLQYLMKTEVRLLLDMCKDLGKVSIELVEITDKHYKIAFGK
jgi:hypothetical protein